MTSEELIALLKEYRVQVRLDRIHSKARPALKSSQYFGVDRFELEDDGSITVVAQED